MIFVAGISNYKIHVIVINEKKEAAMKIFEIKLNPLYPLQKYYTSNFLENILGIQVKYNRFNKLFLIFIPNHDIILFKPKKEVLVSNFTEIKKEDFRNASIYFFKSEIVILRYKIKYKGTSKISMIKIRYNLSKENILIRESEINLVKFADSQVGLSNLIRNDRRGFFNRKNFQTVNDFFFLRDKKGIESLVCFVLINHRVICFKMLEESQYALLNPNSIEIFVSSFVTACVIVLGFIGCTKFLCNFKRSWKKKKRRKRKILLKKLK